MSGGHLDYIEWKILEIAKQIRNDMLRNETGKINGEEVDAKEFAYQQRLLVDTLRYAFITHSYEWALSGDTSFDRFIEDYENASSQNFDYRQLYKEYFVDDVKQLYAIEKDWLIHYTKEIVPSTWEDSGNGGKRFVYGRYEDYYYNPEFKEWGYNRYIIEDRSLSEIIEYRNLSVKKLRVPLEEVRIEPDWD